MEYFDQISTLGHEEVVLCYDKKTKLKAIIAIHSTTLGPALGGCRMWPFETEEKAIEDALRLSRGMTYKNSAAGLKLGGGKAVIIGDSNKEKTKELFQAFGQFVQSLGGRYITAEDVGTSVEDMMNIKTKTDYVAGLPTSEGGSGDPSPFTALGTYEGIKASIKYKFDTEDLKGLKIAIQGLGHVGYYLCEQLHRDGAELFVCDIFQDKVDQIVQDFNATAVNSKEIYSVDADIFAPCALGAILNDDTIDNMKYKIIAGASNNQLLDEEKHGKMLQEKNILYAPDYIINAGGVINVYYETTKEYDKEKVTKKVKNIGNTLTEIYKIADEQSITTGQAAKQLAEKRLNDSSCHCAKATKMISRKAS